MKYFNIKAFIKDEELVLVYCTTGPFGETPVDVDFDKDIVGYVVCQDNIVDFNLYEMSSYIDGKFSIEGYDFVDVTEVIS